MAVVSLLLLSLSLPIAEVYSWTYPVFYLYDASLSNNSYLDFHYTSRYFGLICLTDLQSCCSASYGPHRGDLYFPNGTRLPLSGEIYQHRSAQSVSLAQSDYYHSPSGLYRCDIPTVAIHNDTDISVRESIYIGLYGYRDAMNGELTEST